MAKKTLDMIRMMAVASYRAGWRERAKDWSDKKKMAVLREMSDISLEHPIVSMPMERKLKLKNVPSKEFTGLQLYAGMIELGQELHLPFPEDKKLDRLTDAMSGKAKKMLRREVV